MTRRQALPLLIDRHRDIALQYTEMAQHHLNIAKSYEEHLYEINRPGFRTKGWLRYTGNVTRRIEPYVVQADDGTVK